MKGPNQVLTREVRELPQFSMDWIHDLVGATLQWKHSWDYSQLEWKHSWEFIPSWNENTSGLIFPAGMKTQLGSYFPVGPWSIPVGNWKHSWKWPNWSQLPVGEFPTGNYSNPVGKFWTQLENPNCFLLLGSRGILYNLQTVLLFTNCSIPETIDII